MVDTNNTLMRSCWKGLKIMLAIKVTKFNISDLEMLRYSTVALLNTEIQIDNMDNMDPVKNDRFSPTLNS